MDTETLEFIKKEIEAIEKKPKHGEVTVKIKNGFVYRVIPSPDYLLDKKEKAVV